MNRMMMAGLAAIALTACAEPEVSEVNVTLPADFYAAKQAEVEATLDSFYASAAEADFDTWISLFTENAYFYGTDATEAWPRAEFAPDVKEGFDAGNGWDFEVRDRRVTISPDGETAWFAELSHFANTDYTLRPTGVLVNRDGEWKIAQLVMGVPFPNSIYEPFLNGLQATTHGAAVEEANVEAVLDALHLAAHQGRLDDYMDLYTEDAIFLGTDATERWTMDELNAYAAPAFADGHGWSYDMTERQIIFSPMKNVAWFDELLENEKYGTARGTGTLIRTFGGWKISQYHLTFPIPNDVAEEVISLIQDEE